MTQFRFTVVLVGILISVMGLSAQKESPKSGKAYAHKQDKKEIPKKPDVIEVSFGRGKQLLESNYTPSRCEDVQNVEGLLEVWGPAGGLAKLEIKCDGNVIASCDAQAPGPPMASRCKIPKTAVTEGKLTCPTTVLRGNPVYGSTCVDP
jgi:hypothetical protein